MTDAHSNSVTSIVGAGMVARTHVAACAAAGSTVRLKGIFSRSGKSAKALAEYAFELTGDYPALYASIEELAGDSDVDFVIIATPPNVRQEVIKPLADAGKHILLEKPIARNTDEAQGIVSLCRDANITLGIVFQHRMREASMKAMDLVSSGRLGDLAVAELVVPWWREQSYYDEPGRGTYSRDGGGVLISQAIHTIDLALSLTGPVSSVLAMAKTSKFHQMESEDFVVAGLEFANGAVGSMVASTASFPGSTESISLHFQKASLHLQAGQLIVSWQGGETETFGEAASSGGGADPMAFTHEWHQGIIENFVDSLDNQKQPIASGLEALNAHELIDAAIRSANNGSTQYLTS